MNYSQNILIRTTRQSLFQGPINLISNEKNHKKIQLNHLKQFKLFSSTFGRNFLEKSTLSRRKVDFFTGHVFNKNYSSKRVFSRNLLSSIILQLLCGRVL